jgi:hypothetical protein
VNLPWLAVQVVYAHVAWGMVLAACGIGLMVRWRRYSERPAVAWLVFSFGVCVLPGEASPVHWLGLAFQLPSVLLVACCAMTIWVNTGGEKGRRVLPTGLAGALVAIGALLYVDSAGWLNLGLYVRGFGPEAAFAGVMIGAAALVAIAGGLPRGVSFAVLLSLMLFALGRLPSGNVWDALLDPLLWLWAVFSLLARAQVWWPASRRLETA